MNITNRTVIIWSPFLGEKRQDEQKKQNFLQVLVCLWHLKGEYQNVSVGNRYSVYLSCFVFCWCVCNTLYYTHTVDYIHIFYMPSQKLSNKVLWRALFMKFGLFPVYELQFSGLWVELTPTQIWTVPSSQMMLSSSTSSEQLAKVLQEQNLQTDVSNASKMLKWHDLATEDHLISKSHQKRLKHQYWVQSSRLHPC